MRVAITGGAGFLGAALARRLLGAGAITAAGRQQTLDGLVLADLVPPPADLLADPRVDALVGELADTAGEVAGADVVFHLAGVVSSAAEADLDLGLRTNVDAMRVLLDACRSGGRSPVFVYSSSLAVYGSDPAIGPIGTVDDDTLPRPQSSYGIQKFIGEQLVADYSRRTLVRGRSVRLMTVSVRPGRPNAAASSFLSGIVREPLRGEPAICPVPADTPVALSSPRRTIDGLLAAAAASDGDWGSTTAMNLPALTTTPAAMVAALGRVAGDAVAALVGWEPDDAVARIVTSWPARFDTRRAERLGLRPEQSFDDVIRAYLQEHPDDVRAPAVQP